MKNLNLLVLFICFSFQTQYAQTKPKVENYTLKAMDLSIQFGGMHKPMKIGTISDSGELDFKFPDDLSFIPEENKESYMVDMSYMLFSKCDNKKEILSEEENIKSISSGHINWGSKENPSLGLLFMVSDKSLIPWLEQSYYNSAVLASYYEVIYVESDFNFQGECTHSVFNSGISVVETIYTYDVQLKPGFNCIEYKIESVMEHDMVVGDDKEDFPKIAKPSKIMITSTQINAPEIKWILKYF